jgi:hypothetical protein
MLEFSTNMCIQVTQKKLMITNKIEPTNNPEFFIASGMANIPVPILPFNK